MTYREIQEALAAHREGAARTALTAAVQREVAILDDNPQVRNTRALMHAQEAYARDVDCYLLGDRGTLTPEDVITYRRRAVAWAIAEVLRKHGYGAP